MNKWAIVLLSMMPLSASAAEDCLNFVHHDQQIACLTRENALMQTRLDEVNRRLAEIGQGLVRQSKVRLRNNNWTSICLDNDTGNAAFIHGEQCKDDVPAQIWTLE